MSQEAPVLAIIIGGGPSPGLNGVISSATIYARQLGYKVIAFQDGYQHLATGDKAEIEANVIELDINDVAPISSEGGSIIRPSRYNPKDPHTIYTTLTMLREYKVRYLLIIGGNDKINTTHIVTQGIDPETMQIIVIPKTIDNDIQLPYGQTTFGFHSARKFCAELVANLDKDARSAPRWFVIETMGKVTGHLALSVAEASGAHLCIIPEDFNCKDITLDKICDVFEGAILKRYLAGKPYGICVISEGLISYLSDEEKKSLYEAGYVTVNDDGHINLDEAEISRAIRNRMLERLQKIHLDVKVSPKKIGYELRCMQPVSFDAVYSKELGFAAVEGFRQRHSNCIVVWENGIISFKSFRSLMNPEDGKIYPRLVDVTSQNYLISREYGWQMKKNDLLDEEKVKKLAELDKCTVEEFHLKFDSIADNSQVL